MKKKHDAEGVMGLLCSGLDSSRDRKNFAVVPSGND